MTRVEGTPRVAVLDPSRVPSWGLASAFLLVGLGLVLGLYWHTTRMTVETWNESGAYGHGWLLLPISLYLVWDRRRRLLGRAPRPSLLALVAVALASLVWATAHVLAVNVGEQLAQLGLLVAVVAAVLGLRATWTIAFPLAYLVLGIPVWSLLTRTLQDNTALASAAILQELGVPVYLEGIHISIPAGSFLVEEVCSGLRYLLATMSISALYAYLYIPRYTYRAVFVGVSVVLSITFNWFRVVGIILAGHLSDMQHSLVHNHIGFGWVMFAAALVPLFLLGAWMQRRCEADGQTDASSPTTGSGARSSPRRIVMVGVLLVPALALGPWLVATRATGSVPGDAPAPYALVVGEGWQRVAGTTGPGLGTEFVGAHFSSRASYRGDGGEVSVRVAQYVHQSSGREVVNENNRIFDKRRWTRVSEASVRSGDGAPEDGIVELTVRSSAGERRVVWYWYVVGGQAVTDPLVAKLRELQALVLGRNDAAAVVLSTEQSGDVHGARATLADFRDSMRLVRRSTSEGEASGRPGESRVDTTKVVPESSREKRRG